MSWKKRSSRKNGLFLIKEKEFVLAGKKQRVSPHDALKHHFTFLKTVLIFLKQRVLIRKFPSKWFTNTR